MISTRFEQYSTIWVDHSKSRGSMSVFWRMSSIIGGVKGLKELFKRKRSLLIPSPIFKIAILWSQNIPNMWDQSPTSTMVFDSCLWGKGWYDVQFFPFALWPVHWFHTHNGDIILWYMHIYIYICTICVCILYVVQNEEAFTATKPWFHVENVPQTSPLIETPDVRLAGWDAEPKPETSVKMLGADCSWDFECVRFFREGFRKLNENHPEKGWTFSECYPLVNSLVDPENHPFLMETSLPTPICQGLC